MFRPIRTLLTTLLFLGSVPLFAADPALDRVTLENTMSDTSVPSEQRMEAVCALFDVATEASVPAVMAMLEVDLEERHGFWACAIPLLGKIGDRRAVPQLRLIGDLREEHLAGMDHMAISALAAMAGPEDVAYLEPKAFIFAVRTDVIMALARIAAPSSVEVLITGLDEGEEPEVIAAATQGLIAIGADALGGLDGFATNDDRLMAVRARDIAETIRATK
ncbi:hypothetical protein [Aliiroseovarius subalbicans]|uniref:HEAT repeat domain-containing protein n=1 Tax=Aliiroseovarius subalbicans TaxID=2925840 RepID=UPI001F56241E|nr:hypothetical protein [Aliiroseovarius subalbicans]MCI2400008.1 hypothetical protein [Aliiroseovarius subalbicans]